MIDATPSATPMSAQPEATVTSPEAPFPPADPLPHAVAPSVTDPVSNLDFPPVDDAFALEMRAQSIEQLAGGDALRRGESERIEAGRSKANTDLVAGRARVRVQGTLHEHTGHALAEQAAHLHTTVDGALDVHAASEDTVLLAGHMRDLWDGGAAIVAAMSDDTVGGGGIRVTTPLDLWVHGLMGVEERIGTCTADAVLMELGATHYEREYGPGAHAAGLAVYTGSLYQSSRSTFRALMRVSSGVRNLIAGGGGGGRGGDAGDGGASAASPPPAPAQSGAAQESATGTLAAGRRDAKAPATALATADALTDARRAPLAELVDSVDTRAADEMGEAGAEVRAENLPELTRCADTAERLGRLQETVRIDGAASGSEVASGFRASEVHGVVSMHPADGGGGPLEITPPSAVRGGSAPIARPHPGVAWGQGSELKLGLLGGADRPPQPAAPELDFHAAYRRLRDLHNHYNRLSRTDIARDFRSAMRRVSGKLVRLFESFGGRVENLGSRTSGVTTADRAHLVLQEMAGQADRDGNLAPAGAIRAALDAIDKQTVEELQALCGKHGSATAPSTQAMQRPPMTAGATVTVAAIPPQARPPRQFDWISAYGQLRDLAKHFSAIGRNVACLDVRAATGRMSKAVMHRFRKFVGNPEYLLPRSGSLIRPERAYRALGDMSRRASESDNTSQAYVIRQALEDLDHAATREWDKLTAKYGAPDALFTQGTRTSHASDSSTMDSMRAMQAIPAMQLLRARVGPTTSVALPVTVTPPVTGGAARMPVSALDPDSVGHLVQVPGAPGPPPASCLPGPSLCEAAGARAGDLGRRRFDPPATAPGVTAVEPLATEATVTPSLAGTSSFWLQPADPVAAQGSVPFDAGLHHTGETVQPAPVTTTPSSTAPAPGAAYPVPSWPDDGLAVERALLAGELPPRFDASRLIAEAGMFADFGLAEHLVAGLLPLHTIDRLIEAIQTTDKRGRNALYIERLRSLKESIERALRAAHPGRVDRERLDHVRELLRQRGEPVPPSAASATDLAELDVTEIDRLLRTGEGASHPPPLPPASAPGHTGAGAGAPPPAADPWRIRPPGMSDGPRPVAVDPWSAPPGPSSQVVYTEAMRTPVLSTGAPPGWPGAGPPGFARAASGSVELPFSHRQEIAHRFRTDDALLEAELALQTGGAGALGWSSTRWRAVLADLYRLHHAIVRSDSAAAAATVDVDWNAIEALMPILDVPLPSP